jgi:Tfp pilus assembly major pilin PilA
MKRKQSGVTLLGFILILGVAGVAIYVGMKVIPMYSEYYAVKKSLDGLALEPGINNASPDRIKSLFFRRLYVNYSDNVKPDNVEIERMEGGWKMTVSYEVRRPMIANLDVVGNFVTDKELTHGGPAD